MAHYTVASVPYLNAKPLVRYFEEHPDETPVRVVYDVPSRLPAMLESGDADAALVSSIDALVTPGRRIAEGLCIASEGPVLSVRLFSKVPPGQIRSLALDRSSMTSNALAQIVLAERHGAKPMTRPEPPDLSRMLEAHDAGILIGDNGLRQRSEGLHVLDLGEEWTRLTGLPFVWALWVGRESLTPELAGYLRRARVHSCLGARCGGFLERALKSSLGPSEFDAQIVRRQNAMIAAIAEEDGWPPEQVRSYLLETISYDLGERELQGFRAFADALDRLEIVGPTVRPETVSAERDLLSAASASVE